MTTISGSRTSSAITLNSTSRYRLQRKCNSRLPSTVKAMTGGGDACFFPFLHVEQVVLFRLLRFTSEIPLHEIDALEASRAGLVRRHRPVERPGACLQRRQLCPVFCQLGLKIGISGIAPGRLL